MDGGVTGCSVWLNAVSPHKGAMAETKSAKMRIALRKENMSVLLLAQVSAGKSGSWQTSHHCSGEWPDVSTRRLTNFIPVSGGRYACLCRRILRRTPSQFPT